MLLQEITPFCKQSMRWAIDCGTKRDAQDLEQSWVPKHMGSKRLGVGEGRSVPPALFFTGCQLRAAALGTCSLDVVLVHESTIRTTPQWKTLVQSSCRHYCISA